MERNTPFRLRLNLFDVVLLLCALAAAGVLLFFGMGRSQGAQTSSAATIEYTVLFQRMNPGTSGLIQPGDALVDTVKNYQLGTVESVEIRPAQVQVLNQDTQTYVNAIQEGYEDVYVTVTASVTHSDESILVGGGYNLRVGQTAYVRGPGYMGSGPITAIERGV